MSCFYAFETCDQQYTNNPYPFLRWHLIRGSNTQSLLLQLEFFLPPPLPAGASASLVGLGWAAFICTWLGNEVGSWRHTTEVNPGSACNCMNSYRFMIGLLPCLENIFLGLTCIHLSCLGNKSLIHPLPPRYWCFLIRLRLWLRKIGVYSQTVSRERAWPQSSVAVAVREWLMWCLSRI